MVSPPQDKVSEALSSLIFCSGWYGTFSHFNFTQLITFSSYHIPCANKCLRPDIGRGQERQSTGKSFNDLNRASLKQIFVMQEDSVILWKAVCSNKLLSGVELVLFMNKCDILDHKLRSGIRLTKYLRSFGDRPNDLENAQKCEL